MEAAVVEAAKNRTFKGRSTEHGRRNDDGGVRDRGGRRVGAGDDQVYGVGVFREDGGVPVRRLPVVLFEAEEAADASVDAHWREAVRLSGISSVESYVTEKSLVLDTP